MEETVVHIKALAKPRFFLTPKKKITVLVKSKTPELESMKVIAKVKEISAHYRNPGDELKSLKGVFNHSHEATVVEEKTPEEKTLFTWKSGILLITYPKED